MGEGQARREGDLVWRVRSQEAGEPWVYLYVLLEFQSRPDARMALRVLGYVTMLLGSLLDTGEVGRKAGYPPVLPVVLYNGRRPWRVGTSLAERQHDVPLALLAWLEYVLLASLKRRMDVALDISLQGIGNLSEASKMLADRVDIWFRNAAREGRREGRQEGRQEGLQEGLQAGRHEGLRLMVQLWLTDRFGTELPAWVLHELEQADEAQLMQWAKGISQAPSLAAVFGKPSG